MKAFRTILVLALAACSSPGDGPRTSDGMVPGVPESFAGSWQACDGASAPSECSHYVLAQRGERICGTWAHFASGKEYEGRVIARASSPTQARRTHVCGRPGADTGTRCEDGWEAIDKPLLLCGGRLGDSLRPDGSCFADYESMALSEGELASLLAEPWVEACLAGDP